MKHIILLCDGMADTPVESLGSITPLEAARIPHINRLAANAQVGLVKTVPEGMAPGSDVANLSVMGYDPQKYYTGRSPLEALSMGVQLAGTDVAMRCNLVTLSEKEPFEQKTMVDYCAGDISTAEAKELIGAIQAAFGSDRFAFHAGISYRHCLVWHGGSADIGTLTPPHDISGRIIGPHLNGHPGAAELIRMMKESGEILNNHPVNLKRVEEGKRPANSLWFWGQGKKPALPDFTQKTGLKGSVVSAVDLIKGIGICANMRVVEVPGATGYIDTNFEGKAAAAAKELQDGQDFVYIHVEAPDECGHRGEVQNKVRAIELIDERLLAPLLEELEQYEDYRILLLPDHPTPLATMTHSGEPVPYLLSQKSRALGNGVRAFSEKTAQQTGLLVPQGFTLMDRLTQPER